MSKTQTVSSAIDAIEALSLDDQEKVLFYMISATEIRKDLFFLKDVNKMTFGMISISKVDKIVDGESQFKAY